MNGKFEDKLKALVSDTFQREKGIDPVIFVEDKEDNTRLGVIQVGHLMNEIESKDILSQVIGRLRVFHPTVVFVTEVWMVQVEEGEDVTGVVPSEREDRVERLAMYLYKGDQNTTLVADILRSGDWAELGKWQEVEKGVGRFSGNKPQPPPEWN